MSARSSIEWTDHTFNPWWGCTKVSPGCTNCYAEGMSRRFGGDIWGPKKARRTFGQKHWTAPIRWNARAERDGFRHRVFCASMADVFDRDAPRGARERLWALIEQTPMLDWQLLTKRPEVVMSMVPSHWQLQVPLNVWFGTSVESQDYAWRADALASVPAAVRFLSVEPLLAPVPRLPLDRIDWVIVGGESGPKARPMDPAWVLDVRDQCDAHSVPFFFKQWGGRNKKATGRVLENRTYDEMPRNREAIVAP